MLDLAFAAAILLSAVPFVVGAASAGKIALVIGGIVIAGLVVLYLLARNQEWALKVFARLSQRSPRLQQRGGGFLALTILGAVGADGRLVVPARSCSG